jgi:putative DNA methylase
MIPKECKRLAEVDFPIAVVSNNAAREKAGPPGYPSRLHIWWAHRPLAACRAMALALLLPDPCDEFCPKHFKEQARELLRRLFPHMTHSDADLRKSLLRFIGESSEWSLATNGLHLDVARGLVKAAFPNEAPLVVDPFAGRGSIPLEALRIGCDATGSDLNPVACLMLKILLEYIPRRGGELAEELHVAGAEVERRAKKALADLYPIDSDGAQPIAYLWARTVRCESTDCGAQIPIFKSAWLAKRGSTRAKYFKEVVGGDCIAILIDQAPKAGPITFRIARGHGSEDPRPGFSKLVSTKAAGNNANVVCPCCGTVLPGNKNNPRVPGQLAAQRGGTDTIFDQSGKIIDGARLLAVVTRQVGQQGQQYRMPTDKDYQAVWAAHLEINEILARTKPGEPCPVPDESLPPSGTLGFRVQRYGMRTWGDLFSARQKLSLVKLISIISAIGANQEVATLLAAAFSRVAMSNMSCTRWNPSAEKMQHTFGRQAVPIVWDFAEIVPVADAPGNWKSGYELIEEVVNKWPLGSRVGHVAVVDACEPCLLPESADVWFTDPPYYDAVPYSDLADFFFVWLKRVLPKHPLLQDPYDKANPLSPKDREIVQDETRTVGGRPKDKQFFETQMAEAFTAARITLKDDGIGCVVFAHKSTEGWEALLSGMIRGGWTITGSWPISTEMTTRLRARDSAALATSVHLICRPRSAVASVGDWGQVLRELQVRVRSWMERLQHEGIRGADLVFACIGPALEVFSRYAKVVDAEEREISLGGNAEAREAHKRGYLAYVWEAVGRMALEQVLGTPESRTRNGGTGTLEEDARLTALFLWTLQATTQEVEPDTTGDENESEELEDDEESVISSKKKKGLTMPFDVARRFAQPLGIHLDAWVGRCIDMEKGVVRLIPVLDRAKQLFGDDGAEAVADRLEKVKTGAIQLTLFPDIEEPRASLIKGRKRKGGANVSDDSLRSHRGATTLDHVHAAMVLQSAGRANALQALLKDELARGPDFLRLANALSALYPHTCEEKRLLDAMLLGVPK